MKLKRSFRGIVLHFRKQKRSAWQRFRNDPELFFAIGVVLLWLVVFTIIHMNYLKDLK